jgi:hypothetical protein
MIAHCGFGFANFDTIEDAESAKLEYFLSFPLSRFPLPFSFTASSTPSRTHSLCDINIRCSVQGKKLKGRELAVRTANPYNGIYIYLLPHKKAPSLITFYFFPSSF